jgi:WD40 repeat protein
MDTNEKIELDGISSDGARGIDWNYTGEYVAVGDNDGQILIYDLKGELFKKVNKEDRKSITALAWHPKKNVFIIISEKSIPKSSFSLYFFALVSM